MTRVVSARMAVVALLACAGLFWLAEPAAADEGEVKPIDLVVAVDESGSLSPADVVQEKAAAATIALSELSAQSKVTVFGFASRGASGSAAVEGQQCVLTAGAGAADREALGQCIQRNINRRTASAGDDTDFVAALNQGISALSGGDRPKLLMLLTDGKLDVRGDTDYGPDETAQQQHAEELLKQQVLPTARERGIQIWPLGFGSDLDQGMLEYFAANGGLASCADGKEFTPKATVVQDSGGARLLRAMQGAFANGRCTGSTFAAPTMIKGGGEVELSVTIPAIATDGTITVYKADPQVRVTYTDPDGNDAPSSGEAGGSRFELAGNSGNVEALRIRNPKPGTWKVLLKAPAGLTAQLVTASALWQGVLRSVFVLDPPAPAPGQTFTVVMRPHTRSTEITDPKVLAGLTFEARLTGSGIDSAVPLLDDGKGADAKAGDAFYSASFQLPANASGRYTVRGLASGPGVAVDEHAQTFEPGKVQALNAQIAIDRADIQAGSDRTGTIRVNNTDGREHELRLILKDLNTSGSVTVSPASFTAPPGQSNFQYALAFGGDARGPSGGVLQLVDAASGDVLANTPLGVTINPPKSFVARYMWWLIGGAVVLLAGLALLGSLLYRAHRSRDVRWLRFTLYSGDDPLEPVLTAEHRASRFEFDIRIPTDGYGVAALRDVERGTNRYVARRKGSDAVVLDHPGDGDPLELVVGGARMELAHLPGYAIAVRDGGSSTPRVPIQDTSSGASDDLYSSATRDIDIDL